MTMSSYRVGGRFAVVRKLSFICTSNESFQRW